MTAGTDEAWILLIEFSLTVCPWDHNDECDTTTGYRIELASYIYFMTSQRSIDSDGTESPEIIRIRGLRSREAQRRVGWMILQRLRLYGYIGHE